MDDLLLQAKLDDYTTLTVSPLDEQTYADYVGDSALGGIGGYFVTRSSKHHSNPRFEVLAKAANFEAADAIFQMIIAAHGSRNKG